MSAPGHNSGQALAPTPTTSLKHYEAAQHYITLGLNLVPTRHGSKAPTTKAWNQPEQLVATTEQAEFHWERDDQTKRPLNIGFHHATSGTAILDIDHLEHARIAFASVGLDLDEFLASKCCICGRNGKKPLYRVPEGLELKTRQLICRNEEGKPYTVFELRAGNVQDQLPPGKHPSGQLYAWLEGMPPSREDIPELPENLLFLWQNWDSLKARMVAACPNAPQPQAKALPRSKAAKRLRQVPKTDRVRQTFNAANPLADVLGRNGYTAQNSGRWTAPNSTTGTPGVTLLPSTENGPDQVYSHHAADTLATGHPHDAFSVYTLLEHHGDEPAARAAVKGELEPPDVVRAGNYIMRDGQLWLEKPTRAGPVEFALTSFTAWITAEIRYDDGGDGQERHLELAGQHPSGQPFSPIVLKASEFEAMSWPLARWGAHANVFAGSGNRDHVRSAIQALSAHQGFAARTIYRHLGWTQHPEHGPLYLSADAAIGAQGSVSGIAVEMPGRLAAYALPAVPAPPELITCVRASLELLHLVPDSIGVPVLGAAFRAVLGQGDFTVFIVGRTGSHKTTFTALVMAHFGPKWRYSHMPEGWESTANALERHAYVAKDTLFGVDDFKPRDPKDPVYRSLSRMLRAQADGAGRSRLSQGGQTSQVTYHPRGLMITSAETVPRDHSDQARALFVNVTAPLLGPDREKSAAFYEAAALGESGIYAGTLAGLVRHIAQHWTTLHAGSAVHQQAVRHLATHFNNVQAHDRTPRMCGELARGWQVFLEFAVSVEAVTQPEADALLTRAIKALHEVAATQSAHHKDVDPVLRFLQLLRELFSTRRAFVEDAREGKAPRDHPESLGWRSDPDVGFLREPSAARLGWLGSLPNGELCLYLQPDSTVAAVSKLAADSGAPLPLTSGPLASRLKEAGILGPCEPGKTLHRRTVHGAPGRPDLWHIRWEVFAPDTGTAGTAKQNSLTPTASTPVPTSSVSSGQTGTTLDNDMMLKPF
ncbi:bifunctional DNA primase/polymerase [Deinococcus marmoris]|uniref:bifunctional DNA primase/polymerase n=1 Tax=Deinococcus marmoris TaxID=249408 RepID=UPI0004951128|nr:bifunctional DNA primase/polymerase [Deinococcus marmoris]